MASPSKAEAVTPSCTTAATTAVETTSKWHDRRKRRRERQRQAKEAERATIIEDDEKKNIEDDDDITTRRQTERWKQTDERLYRNAVRNEVKSCMVGEWQTPRVLEEGEEEDYRGKIIKKKGLQIVIDCGMADLMCDAELKSLVTQLQLSYAAVLGLTVEHVMGKNERKRTILRDDDTDVGTAAANDEDINAAAINSEATDNNRPCSSGEIRCNEARNAIHATYKKGQVTRIMFSSLGGRVAEALGRDGGSKSWSVHTSPLHFMDAAGMVATSPGSETADMMPPRHEKIIVLSPDAPKALSGPLCTETIYIVGGLCDYRRIRNATLDRASSVGVEARRLPIEEVMFDNCSVNILTVNQAVEALVRVSLNDTGDWSEALRAVIPTRKQHQ